MYYNQILFFLLCQLLFLLLLISYSLQLFNCYIFNILILQKVLLQQVILYLFFFFIKLRSTNALFIIIIIFFITYLIIRWTILQVSIKGMLPLDYSMFELLLLYFLVIWNLLNFRSKQLDLKSFLLLFLQIS